jgi:arsenate reductase
MPKQKLLDIGALLDHITARLARRLAGVSSTETVDRYVHESYTAVHRTARIKTYLPT